MKTREEEEEENGSECSSGCQSGWTMYFDQSEDEDEPKSLPIYEAVSDEEEEGEDLSMVSDASSGPPHFPDEDHECYQNSEGKKTRVVEVVSSPSLDDTASSPFFSFPKASSAAHKVTKEELSCGFSTTHFKRMPAFYSCKNTLREKAKRSKGDRLHCPQGKTNCVALLSSSTVKAAGKERG